MKIFYYDINDGKYKWSKVKIGTSRFDYGQVRIETEELIKEIYIYKILGDVRRKDEYVRCSYCKKIMKKSQIEAHWEKLESQDCLKCSHLSREQITTENMTRIVRNDDGSVTATQKIKFIPTCSDCYRTCTTAKETGRCRFMKCRQYGYNNMPTSKLSEYPNMKLGKQITAKQLLDKGFACDNLMATRYKYKNTNLYAHTDVHGIVMYFVYDGKYESQSFYYSQKLDKFFTIRNGRYCDDDIINCTTSDKTEWIKNTVRKLYK